MAEVTWFKVLTDIFADDKIKILQSMPEGDALLVMWFKILSQAGKTNDGGYIYLKKNIPYTSSMLSTLFNKNQLLVDLAIRTFAEFGMIDIDEKGYIFVTNWEKHQSIDALEKIKEQTRTRVQSHREKKKLELQESNATVTLQVTHGNATELELDLELEREKDINTPVFDDPKLILNHWNAKKIIVHREMTAVMKGHINARLEKYTVDELTETINNYHAIITDSDKYWFQHKFTLTDFMNPKNLDRFLSENNPFETLKKNVVQFNRPETKGSGQAVPSIDETKLKNAEFERLKEEKRQRLANKGVIV